MLRIRVVYPGSEFFHPGSWVKKIPGSASASKNSSILSSRKYDRTSYLFWLCTGAQIRLIEFDKHHSHWRKSRSCSRAVWESLGGYSGVCRARLHSNSRPSCRLSTQGKLIEKGSWERCRARLYSDSRPSCRLSTQGKLLYKGSRERCQIRLHGDSRPSCRLSTQGKLIDKGKLREVRARLHSNSRPSCRLSTQVKPSDKGNS